MKNKVIILLIILISLLLGGCRPKHPGIEHDFVRTTKMTEFLSDEPRVIEYKCALCSERKTEEVSSIFNYTVNGDEVILTSIQPTYKREFEVLRIPDTYNGKPVTEINTKLLEGSKNLKEVIIPKNIKVFYEGVFYDCPNIETIYYEGTLEEWLNIEMKSFIFDELFIIKNVYMKDSNNEYYKLQKVNIPESITEVGDFLFAGFSFIEEITFHDNLKRIGKYAFDQCKNITKLIIPNSVEEMQFGSFRFCESLTELTMPQLNYYTWNHIFNKNKVTKLTLTKGDYIYDNEVPLYPNDPHSVAGVFSSFKYLETITIPASITKIGDVAFANCKNLKNVIFEEGSKLTEIGSYTFFNCESLTNIVIPEGVEIIDTAAFLNCESLTNVVIPNNVNTINEYTFMNCINLQTFTFGKNTKIFEEKIFDGCENLKDVYFNGNLEDWCNISFDSSPGYKAKNIYLKNNDQYEILTELVIPETITRIGKYQFAGFSEVIDVTIPSTVTRIEDQAFYNCANLKKIFIDLNIKYVGYNIFENCDKVKIYCEHNSKPSSWDKDWCKGKYCYWDYKNSLGIE